MSKKLTATEKTVLGSIALHPTDSEATQVLNHTGLHLSSKARNIGAAVVAIANKESTKGINSNYIRAARKLLTWAKKVPVA